MRRSRRRLGMIALLACIAPIVGCAPRYSGPWNMAELKKAPVAQWGIPDLSPGKVVREVYYAGEPYQGHATRVFAYYARPNPSRTKLPAMVLVHGGGGKAFREWAELWADRGYAAIAMDLAGRGPDGNRLPDAGPDQDEDAKFTDIGKGLREAWPYHAVAAVVRAHSLLRSLPDVDPSRTGITGISWGGYLTCIVAGIDDRFKVAVPVYGCGYLDHDSAWVKRLGSMPADQRQLWIDNFDPSRYLPGVHEPILFVNGTNDFAYPLDSYQESYRAVPGPRTLCITVRMPHGHPPGWAPKEIGLFVDSVLTRGKPLAQVGPVTTDGVHVTARVRSAVPIRTAELHYTRDLSLPWQKRDWTSVSAKPDTAGTTVTADLPAADGIVWFLTVTDERGATVSSEHEGRVAASTEARRSAT